MSPELILFVIIAGYVLMGLASCVIVNLYCKYNSKQFSADFFLFLLWPIALVICAVVYLFNKISNMFPSLCVVELDGSSISDFPSNYNYPIELYNFLNSKDTPTLTKYMCGRLPKEAISEISNFLETLGFKKNKEGDYVKFWRGETVNGSEIRKMLYKRVMEDL